MGYRVMSTYINAELPDELTPQSCSVLVVAIIKYVAYTTGHIPYIYDGFRQLVTNARRTNNTTMNGENVSTVPPSYQQLKANTFYRRIEKTFNNFEKTFKNIEHVMNNEANEILEILLVLGTSVASPRHVYRIKIPQLNISDCLTEELPMRRNLGCLLREILAAECSQPVSSPSNMFVLLSSRCPLHIDNYWFLPKWKYSVPSRVSQTHISFYNISNSDIDKTNSTAVESNLMWYQARETLNGFKDLKINGISVYNILSKS